MRREQYTLLNRYVYSTKRSNVPFELTDEQFFDLTQEDCFYCGKAPANGWNNYEKDPFVWNGIDRVDNTLGYAINNCVSCCSLCNRMKGTLSWTEFIEHTKAVVSHLNTRIEGTLKKRMSLVGFIGKAKHRTLIS